MKKTLIFLVVLFISVATMAQKGSMYVGGQFGFGSTKTTDYTNNNTISKTNLANFSPEVGMFLANDISIGLAVNFSSDKDDNDVADTDYDKLVLTSPVIYVRKFWSIEDIFSAFVGLDVNFSTGNYKEKRNDAVTTVNKVSGFGANLNVGIAYPLGKRFTAVGKYGLIGYSTATLKDDAGAKELTINDFGFNVNTLGSLFNIGLYYTFLAK